MTMGRLACAVMHAAAAEMNDELAIVLSGIAVLIEATPGDDLPMLQEMRMAAERCACKTSTMIQFSLAAGIRCPRATAESLAEMEPDPQ